MFYLFNHLYNPMNTYYHPKYGVKFSTVYVAVTVDLPNGEKVPESFCDDLPLCKEVVDTIEVPIEQGDCSIRYIGFNKDHLIELLEYAKQLEVSEPLFTEPTLDKAIREIKGLKLSFGKSPLYNNHSGQDINETY